jgi:glycosyltransferase involved in cell wall biosynthesis
MKPGEHMSKRVLMLLTNCFDPDPRVHAEARTLCENDYGVTILAWDRDRKRPRKERFGDIQVKRIFVRSTHGRGTAQVPFLLCFWLALLMKGLREKFDIIHCHDLDTLLPGMILGRLRGKKILFDAHESFPDMLGDNVSAGLKKLLRAVETFLVKRVDALITVGELLRQEYQRRGARNAYVVGNWKRIEDFSSSQGQDRREHRRLGIPADALVITYIAWLSQERQLPALMAALEDDAGLFLLIGGDGPLRGEVEQCARASVNMQYLGYVPPERVPLYTAMADVIYYGFDAANPNSKYSAPNKLFEALAAGKAVVTGDFGEIGRIVVEEQCGLALPKLTVESLKEAFTLMRQGDFLRRCQENALRAGRERYNWPRAAEELMHAYIELTLN